MISMKFKHLEVFALHIFKVDRGSTSFLNFYFKNVFMHQGHSNIIIPAVQALFILSIVFASIVWFDRCCLFFNLVMRNKP